MDLSESESDTARLLPGSRSQGDRETADMKTSIFTLTDTIFGVGILALPWAFSKCGLILGLIILVLGALSARLGLMLMVKCTESLLAESEAGEQPSYAMVAHHTFPQIRYFADFCISFVSLGTMTVFMVVIAQLIPQLIEDFGHLDGGWYTDRQLYVALAFVIEFPICMFFAHHLDSFEWTSFFALGTVAYIAAVVVSFFGYSGETHVSDIVLFNWSIDVFYAIPFYSLIFSCHSNICEIFHELENPTHKRISTVINVSLGNGFVIYFLVGVFGYLTFADNLEANLLSAYPNNISVMIAKFGMVILLLLNFPLSAFPCRFSVHHVICWIFRIKMVEVHDGLMWKIEMALTVTIPFIVAMFVTDLGFVFSLVGSVGAVTVSYILPALFYLKHTSKSPAFSDRFRVGAWFLLIGGVIIASLGLATTISNQFT